MKHLIAFSLLITIISCSTNSAIKNGNNSAAATKDSTAYPLAVSFNSICCGTASSDFLKSFVVTFNQRNGTNISADIAAACGKEGEFVLLFKMPDNERANQKFKRELESIIEQTDAQNKKTNSSSGGIALLQNARPDDYKNCRLGITAWDLK